MNQAYINMRSDMKEERLKLLNEVYEIESKNCHSCEPRIEFNNAKDLTGLHKLCKSCPVFSELSQYGKRLNKLTSARKSYE